MPPATAPSSLFDKVWNSHVVSEGVGGRTLLYIDRHYLIDDLPLALYQTLDARGIPVRRPEATFAMTDHYASTRGTDIADVVDSERQDMVRGLAEQTRRRNIVHFGLGDARQGIVHVVGPEQGLTLPGMTVVCGDSHTTTHGALGAFGFGIGSTEVGHVLATQTLWQVKPKQLSVRIDGKPRPGVTAKDLALAVIRRVGVAGAVGHVIEYSGAAVDALTVEGRMTLCNMSTEAGARAGMIAADRKTLAYLQGRPYAPQGAAWEEGSRAWSQLRSDSGARFDRTVDISGADIQPMVTWGTDPSQSCDITQEVPDPNKLADPTARENARSALEYMALRPGQPMLGLRVDRVFIGSCTNSRIEDLRLAASVVKGRHAVVPALVVPGSRTVKAQAEAEGLDRVFKDAGMEWRLPGCSMCVAINGDHALPGERCVSTTNRNFVGRQGRGVRTHLVNPGMAAAAAVHGCLVDFREELTHAGA
ncbi:MAG: 3-isopropylmalate dehydratase large subunit [Burkholderiales bacterium]|nr:3-isopropylmalate dehydratase large subunit [Burkholderiales bacterium]